MRALFSYILNFNECTIDAKLVYCFFNANSCSIYGSLKFIDWRNVKWLRTKYLSSAKANQSKANRFKMLALSLSHSITCTLNLEVSMMSNWLYDANYQLNTSKHVLFGYRCCCCFGAATHRWCFVGATIMWFILWPNESATFVFFKQNREKKTPTRSWFCV